MQRQGTITERTMTLSGKTIRVIAAVLIAALGVYIGFLMPFAPDLGSIGHKALMGLVVALGLWIFRPLDIPFSVTAGLMLAIFLASGIPSANVFSGYTSPAIWILIPALFFGFALAQTGLGRRLAFLIIRMFEPSYLGLTLAWVIIGIVLSALTPSITVRTAIMTPIAVTCCDLAKLPNGSKGRALILLTAISMAILPGAGWMTGTLTGPTLIGFYNATEGLQGIITFSSWAQVALLEAAVTTVLLVVGGYFVMKPSEPMSQSITKQVFVDEYRKLGAWSRAEKWTAGILVGAFLMFVTAPLHKIPDAATCLLAFFLLTSIGVISAQDIGPGINWDIVIFIGAGLSIGSVVAFTGTSKWLASLVVPALAPIAHNPWMFCFAVVIFLFAWRFVDIVIMIPTEAILIPILPAIAAAYHIDPLVWIGLFILPINAMFMNYQNSFVLVGESLAKERGWRPNQLLVYGSIYFVASLLTLLVVIPYWIGQGFFR
ncbi:MAG: anion permease [Chloroflexi bacterium]|nr:anion permease [Chloroflexota bacterium]